MASSDKPPASARWDLGGRDLEVLLNEAARFKGESLWQDAWRRLKHNRTAFWSLLFLVFVGLGSTLAPLLPLPSPAALNLQSEPGPPVLPWSTVAANDPNGAPGSALGDQGWRHRSLLLFAAPESLHPALTAWLSEQTSRRAIVPPPYKELPQVEPGQLLLAVPLRTVDVPGVDYDETGKAGRASIEVVEEVTAPSDDAGSLTAAPPLGLRITASLPLTPEGALTWSFARERRRLRAFARPALLDPWTRDYEARIVLPRKYQDIELLSLSVNGVELVAPAAEDERKWSPAESLSSPLVELMGRIRNDLGKRVTAALAERSDFNGVEVLALQIEDAYWDLGLFDRGMLWVRGALFGTWQTGAWLGTDSKGRDVMSRIVWGSRTSILVALAATLCSLMIGVTYGALSGYLGGSVDNLMMRVVDVLYSIPFIFVVIFLMTIVNEYRTDLADRGIDRELIIYLVIGAIYWLTMARVVRGQVLSLKNSEFVDAARVLGASTNRIVFVHLVPNVLSIVIVYLTLTIPAVMLFEAFLSFLGLGIESPKVSWGLLATDSTEAFSPIKVYWWLVVWPAAAMGATLLALNILGDGLRDALDPKLRGKD